MRINLKVPFAENAEAKKCGAKWDGKSRTWYANDKRSIKRCKRWWPDLVNEDLIERLSNPMPIHQSRHLREISAEV